jgi:hypothetical protein
MSDFPTDYPFPLLIGGSVHYFDQEGAGPFAAIITAIDFNPKARWHANLAVFIDSGITFKTNVGRAKNVGTAYDQWFLPSDYTL